MAQTENYKLYVVGAGEDPYVKDFVEQLCGENASNMTIIDNALKELKTSVSEGKALVSSAVTDMGVSTADDATYATIASNIKNISNDATASTGEILSGETAYSGGKKITGTMVNQGAKTAALNCGGSYTIPAGYHNGSGKVTANSLSSQTAGTAVAGDILAGKTAYVDGVKITGTIATQGAKTITPSTSVQTAVPSGIYTTGAVTVSAVPTQTKSVSPTTASQTVTPDNGKFLSSVSVGAISTQTKSVTPTTSIQTVSPDSGKYLTSVSVGAIPNTYVKPSATKAATTYTPTTSNQTIAAGTYCSEAQTIVGDADLVSANIKSGVSIFGVEGSLTPGVDTSDATATSTDIAAGTTAYVNGTKITGVVPVVSAYETVVYDNASVGVWGTNISLSKFVSDDNGILIKDWGAIYVRAPISEFGDATAADVAEGKTFTSAAGLKVTGTGGNYKYMKVDETDVTGTRNGSNIELILPIPDTSILKMLSISIMDIGTDTSGTISVRYYRVSGVVYVNDDGVADGSLVMHCYNDDTGCSDISIDSVQIGSKDGFLTVTLTEEDIIGAMKSTAVYFNNFLGHIIYS